MPHTQARPDETFLIDLALSSLRGEFWPRFYDYPHLYGYVITALYLLYFAQWLLVGRFTSLTDLVASWHVYWQRFLVLSHAVSARSGTLPLLIEASAVGARGRVTKCAPGGQADRTGSVRRR